MNIVYEDEWIIVIDKPSKMMVYPTLLAKNCHWFATKELAKLGYEELYTIHRLDRPTSGVLLFAKNKEMAKELSFLFKEGKVEKKYNCIVRGHTDIKGVIEKELRKDGEGVLQVAETHFQTLDYFLLNEEINKYPQSRFSFLEVEPKTGRMHQIRRHFAHLRNPIIGDKRYGDRHYNKFMNEKYEIETMMLHARSIRFDHPISKNSIKIEAPLSSSFIKFLEILSPAKIPAPHQV